MSVMATIAPGRLRCQPWAVMPYAARLRCVPSSNVSGKAISQILDVRVSEREREAFGLR